MPKRLNRSGLGFLKSAATRTHSLARIAADRAGVGLGALVANRKASLMPRAAHGTDVLKALDVLANFAAQLTFDGEALCKGAYCLLLVRRKLAPLPGRIDFRLRKDFPGTRWADAVNERQRIGELFVVGKRDAGYTHR